MKKMQFIKNNTVIFNDREINLDTFFSILNRNIDDKKYSVYYSKKNEEFTIFYDGEEYEVVLGKKLNRDLKNNISNPIIKQLISLSRVQEMVDLANNDGIIASEVLDDDSKKTYLTNLKNKKFSFKDYIFNFEKDLSDSKKFVCEKFDDYYELDFIIGGCICALGAIGALYGCCMTNNGIHLLWILSGAPIIVGKYLLYFIFSQITKRFNRLVNATSNSKLRKTKIKSLEKSLKSSNLLISNGAVNDDKKVDKHEVKSIIPVMINKLIELLKGVDPINRGTLTSEIRDFLLEYQEMISDSAKTDRELFLENRSICDRIVDLELRINAAKRLNSNREYETNYLLGKLDSLEDNSEEIEGQKVYCKIR